MKKILTVTLATAMMMSMGTGIAENTPAIKLFDSSISASAANKISIKNATISGITTKTYNGRTQTQNIKVKFDNETLKEGTDYEVSYRNNVNAGTAYVLVKGIGKFSEIVGTPFKINKLNISNFSDMAYAGTPWQNPMYLYNSKGVTNFLSTIGTPMYCLNNGQFGFSFSNYQVKFTNNNKIGTATATYTGVGNCTGTKTIKYDIGKLQRINIKINQHKSNANSATIFIGGSTSTKLTEVKLSRLNGYFTGTIPTITINGYTYKNVKIYYEESYFSDNTVNIPTISIVRARFIQNSKNAGFEHNGLRISTLQSESVLHFETEHK